METKFTIDKKTALSLIAVEKQILGEDLYQQILNDPRDYSYKWLNKLEDIANDRV